MSNEPYNTTGKDRTYQSDVPFRCFVYRDLLYRRTPMSDFSDFLRWPGLLRVSDLTGQPGVLGALPSPLASISSEKWRAKDAVQSFISAPCLWSHTSHLFTYSNISVELINLHKSNIFPLQRIKLISKKGKDERWRVLTGLTPLFTVPAVAKFFAPIFSTLECTFYTFLSVKSPSIFPVNFSLSLFFFFFFFWLRLSCVSLKIESWVTEKLSIELVHYRWQNGDMTAGAEVSDIQDWWKSYLDHAKAISSNYNILVLETPGMYSHIHKKPFRWLCKNMSSYVLVTS